MAISPEIRSITIHYKGRTFSLEYFNRPGEAGTIIFVHGLGGAKENFWDSTKVPALRITSSRLTIRARAIPLILKTYH